jgi:molybdopterin-synthase adenylyltransferase
MVRPVRALRSWANGILASSAVGIAVDLVTGWTRRQKEVVYLSYDGNTGLLTPHVRLRCLREGSCSHYPPGEVGDPIFRPIGP